MTGLSAYVDESVRPGRYLMCVVLVEPSNAGHLRSVLQGLLLPRQRRLHFQKESRARRRRLISARLDLDVHVAVFSCRQEIRRSERDAREICLTAIIEHVQAFERDLTMYVERREGRDGEDRRVLDRARAVPHRSLTTTSCPATTH